jgi:hypothetical protein
VDGRTQSANTYPGGSVNRQIAGFTTGAAVDVLLNGRGQVVAVFTAGAREMTE